MGNLLRPKTSKCKVLKVFEFKMKFYVEITLVDSGPMSIYVHG